LYFTSLSRNKYKMRSINCIYNIFLFVRMNILDVREKTQISLWQYKYFTSTFHLIAIWYKRKKNTHTFLTHCDHKESYLLPTKRYLIFISTSKYYYLIKNLNIGLFFTEYNKNFSQILLNSLKIFFKSI